VSRRSRLVEREVLEEVHPGVSAVEAEVVVPHVEEEVSQAAGVHQEEAQEVSVQARTEGLQEGEEGALVVVVEAIKLMLHQCLHVADAAFREYPQRLCGWLGHGTGSAVSLCTRAKRCKIIYIRCCFSLMLPGSLNSVCKHTISAQKLFTFARSAEARPHVIENHKPDPRKEFWSLRVRHNTLLPLLSQLSCVGLFSKLLLSVESNNSLSIIPHTLRHVTKIRRSQCRQ
jgi:hypothetical protein